MARRSQCSSAGDNPLDPNYLPPHYREEYRLAIDALIEEDLEGYYQFLEKADVVDFLSSLEIQYIQSSVQVPQQSSHPEQHFLETGVDGSSDTYWPIHSDLDAPGLDLGWPQLHHFIGPTEVTTLVNPPEPDMPSIKEQARRLIKNAQQVIAIVMDVFTDVDMFADILNAAMRNVAVYILLDKHNVHHFVNMVSNCRVDLQSIQFLRVRTVSGITYQCRSGKSFNGQMMDRFLLTDCRAVLSGNYSFMWSFEKLHRCMAHLFLGQLVSTFDEEFRILFAQSQPLVIENAPVEDFSLLPQRQYPGEITSLYREPRTFPSVDAAHTEEWAIPSYDERMDMDWRMKPLKRQEFLRGPADMYNRFPSQQSRMDPAFDQGTPRMMENPTFKRHSYAEGLHGRYPYPFLQQQGLPEPEDQGRQIQRGKQPYPGPGVEPDYSGYDKFWNQDYHSADQYSDPGLTQEMEPPDNFDPVLNYLSSTRNVGFDQGPEKLLPVADVPFSSSHPRRLRVGQPYACQTSPTPSNPTDQKHFFQEPNTDRKDPMVKQGLRNWRISSYLSACDNPGDEDLPLAVPNAPDPFEESSNLIQQTAPGMYSSVPKIPNVREFKVPAKPRASQMPSYAKMTAQEQTRKLTNEPTAVAAPTPSESTTEEEKAEEAEGEKAEEAEQKEPKTSGLQREESFRRKYNAALPRSSRLRSSLIFSSLEQLQTSKDTKTVSDQQDQDSDKNEAEQTKLPFAHVLGQRRSAAREPFEWSRYIKPASFDNSATDSSKPADGNSKADDKDSSKDLNSMDLAENREVQESLKLPDVEQANSSPSVPRSKHSEAELPKTDPPAQPPRYLLTSPLDMSDPDKRLMFFKELAAKRKSAKAAEAQKSKEKAPMKPPTELKHNTTLKKEESVPKETSELMADTSTAEGLSEKNDIAEDAGKAVSTETCQSVSLPLHGSDKTNKEDSQVKNDPNASQSCKKEQTSVPPDSEKTEFKNSHSAAALPVSVETIETQSKPPEESKLSDPSVKKSRSSHPLTPTHATPANVPSLAQGTDESESPCLDSTSKHSSSLTPSSVEVAPTCAFAVLDSNTQSPESVQLETSISFSPHLSEQQTGSQLSSSSPSVKCILPDSGSQISPSPSPSIFAPLSTPAETISSVVTPEDSSSTLTSSILSPDAQESVSPPQAEPSQSVKESLQKSTASAISQSESTQAHLYSVSQLMSHETRAVESAHVGSDISPDGYAAGSEPDTSSLESTSKTEESCAPTSLEKDVPESENNSISKSVGEESEVHGSSVGVKADGTPPSLSPPSPELYLLNVSDLENKSRSDQKETMTPTPSPADPISKSVGEESEVHGSSVGVKADGTPPSLSPPSPELYLLNVSDLENKSRSDQKETMTPTPSPADPISKSVGEESEVHGSSVGVKADGTPPSLSPPSPELYLLNVSDLENKSRSDQKETMTPTPSPADPISKSVGEESEVHGSSVGVKADGTPPSLSPPSPELYLLNVSDLENKSRSDQKETITPTPSPSDHISKGVGEESEVLGSPKDLKADSTPPSLRPPSPESYLLNASDLENKSRSDQKETMTPTPSPADPSPECSPAQTSSPVHPDFTRNASQSETSASPQDAQIQSTPPSKLYLTGPVTPTSVEIVSCSSPLTESFGSVLSPEAEKTLSALHKTSDANSLPKQVRTDSNEQPMLPSTETSSPTEPTPKVPTEHELPCRTTPSESSSTTKEEKAEEQKEPITTVVQREESVHRKFNAALQTSSSSLIFSSLEAQQTSEDTKTASDLQDQDSDKNEAAEKGSPVHSHFTPNASQSETTASPQDTPIQATPPSELNLTGPFTPTPAEIMSCSSPLTESGGLVLTPVAEKTLSALHSPSDTNTLPKQVTTDSNETPMWPSAETSSPTEPNSEVPTQPDLPSKPPKSVTFETHPSEPPVPAENSKVDGQNEVSKQSEMPDYGEKKRDNNEATNKVDETTTQELVCSEKTNDQVRQNNCSRLSDITSDEVIVPSPQSKQPKSSQSRYHTSTANVLSSSNLRDDTKLLLEQISANNQSRNEAAKEAPVTDDEKEDKADKNAKREKEGGIRSFSRDPPRSNQEREKALERIQSMRNTRKVYSRFEL
ncbi:protein FAM83H isoform X2 [Micropterus dolomieu]|uniref:protein FAM83H isoform X2 n=1 Tax=Micropterus dolomieu TaxID=147949 RepID=UPI001E8CC76D|nr:protein FAM83H isoform X2 [Micropterus dolomieu]